ncbi:MAG TPA: diguanylate cyclase [Pyrinomonadaceae bacterium]|nr:diguanylate cyclase [Pyrinomonadaceae bacterium]
MRSLYDSLLAQHPRQLSPLRCSQSTITQLHRYFEEVVLENGLEALVVESLPSGQDRSASELTRVKDLVQGAANLFVFLQPDDALRRSLGRKKTATKRAALLDGQEGDGERFVVIVDARFCAVLSCSGVREVEAENGSDLVVWSFEPDVVYSAVEHLMARMTAEQPSQANAFVKAVDRSMPQATSLQLTLGVTTKLARLLQEQAEREIAVNRIATAIRNSLELDNLLLTAANEVGRSLSAKSCGVLIEGDLVGKTMTGHYFRSEPVVNNKSLRKLLADLKQVRASLHRSKHPWIVDGPDPKATGNFPQAAVPLIYQGASVGVLLVQSDDPTRVWAENELLLLHTVADQLTVAVKQAHLFAQMQVQALTDGLTGCYNRRAFDLQLQKDLHLAMRMRHPLALIILDLDDFKQINDCAGHDVGDSALRSLAETFRRELRAVDTAARFGGDEFAIILPQAGTEGALVVAERLRRRIAATEIPGYGPMSASFGVAAFPFHASSRDSLVVTADRALYQAKRAGRNQVSLPSTESESDPLEVFEAEVVTSERR